MKDALLFNIQRCCVHDGPGIRTTLFFKGCPLRCQWCHNPESQSFDTEMLCNSDRCSQCQRCSNNCPQQAYQRQAGNWVWQENRCQRCGLCVDNCLQSAREIAGQPYTLTQLLQEVEKDRPFYEQSGGGVTFSGGEAMVQIEPLAALAAACKERDISVAVDTCGYVPQEHFKRMIPLTDVFLYDIKLMDPILHRYYTGQDNLLILENLRFLSQQGASIQLRLPLLGGINDTDDQLEALFSFIDNIPLIGVNLLPYHDIASGKYQRLSGKVPVYSFAPPSQERLQEIAAAFKQKNLQVTIGG